MRGSMVWPPGHPPTIKEIVIHKRTDIYPTWVGDDAVVWELESCKAARLLRMVCFWVCRLRVARRGVLGRHTEQRNPAGASELWRRIDYRARFG